MRSGMLLLLATAILAAGARPSFAQETAAQPPAVPAAPPAAPPPVPYHPRLIIEVDLGLDQGGDDLGDGVRAGQGVVLSGLGSVTPLWIQDRIGLGGGIAFGWKYSSVGDRVPVAAFGQALVSLHGPWFSALRAGPMKLVSTDMPSDWGVFVDLGVCRWFEDRLALALLLRFTHLNLNRQGEKIDADSFGVALGAAFGD
jgi:hypothetical protein